MEFRRPPPLYGNPMKSWVFWRAFPITLFWWQAAERLCRRGLWQGPHGGELLLLPLGCQEAWWCNHLWKVLFKEFTGLACVLVSTHPCTIIFPWRLKIGLKATMRPNPSSCQGGCDNLKAIEGHPASIRALDTIYMALGRAVYSSYIIYTWLFNKISELPGFRPFVQYGKSSGAEWGQVRRRCFEPNKCCPPTPNCFKIRQISDLNVF